MTLYIQRRTSFCKYGPRLSISAQSQWMPQYIRLMDQTFRYVGRDHGGEFSTLDYELIGVTRLDYLDFEKGTVEVRS